MKKIVQNFVWEIIEAQTRGEIDEILYRADGVNETYRAGKISYDDCEMLFALACKIQWKN